MIEILETEEPTCGKEWGTLRERVSKAHGALMRAETARKKVAEERVDLEGKLEAAQAKDVEAVAALVEARKEYDAAVQAQTAFSDALPSRLAAERKKEREREKQEKEAKAAEDALRKKEMNEQEEQAKAKRLRLSGESKEHAEAECMKVDRTEQAEMRGASAYAQGPPAAGGVLPAVRALSGGGGRLRAGSSSRSPRRASPGFTTDDALYNRLSEELRQRESVLSEASRQSEESALARNRGWLEEKSERRVSLEEEAGAEAAAASAH